jgi:glycosyltransferase involved in cell wall biosynthesis
MFTFVVPYYNTGSNIEKTLFSMLAQSSDDWRAIVIDDMSTDSTPDIVDQVVTTLPDRYRSKFTHVRNTEKHGEVRNTLVSLRSIDDDDVVCRLDGGDWLVENDLLVLLKRVYSDRNVAVAWTAHRWGYTSNNISGPMRLNPRQTVYQHPWVSSHLKTFRACNLRDIPDGNFKDENGEYITIACDQAVFLPMMHRASSLGRSLVFVPVVAYHYDIDLARPDLFTNDRSIRQKTSAEWIRERGYVE